MPQRCTPHIRFFAQAYKHMIVDANKVLAYLRMARSRSVDGEHPVKQLSQRSVEKNYTSEMSKFKAGAWDVTTSECGGSNHGPQSANVPRKQGAVLLQGMTPRRWSPRKQNPFSSRGEHIAFVQRWNSIYTKVALDRHSSLPAARGIWYSRSHPSGCLEGFTIRNSLREEASEHAGATPTAMRKPFGAFERPLIGVPRISKMHVARQRVDTGP